MESKMPEGFTCECGKFIEFGAYVAAHWDFELTHICDCGRKHAIKSGIVKLVYGGGNKNNRREYGKDAMGKTR